MADNPKDLETVSVVYIPADPTSYAITRHVTDMTPEAAAAHTAIAKYQASAVDSQYGVPARQETGRTAIIVGGVIGVTILAAVILPASALPAIITTAIVTLGGAWSVTTIADKFKKLPPKS